jgi:hypothetical protein
MWITYPAKKLLPIERNIRRLYGERKNSIGIKPDNFIFCIQPKVALKVVHTTVF